MPSGAVSVNVTVPTSPPGLPVSVAVSLSVTVSPTVALLGEADVVSVGVTSVMITCSVLLLPSSVIGLVVAVARIADHPVIDAVLGGV